MEFNKLHSIIDMSPNHAKNFDTNIESFCYNKNKKTYKHNKVNINSKNNYINASWINFPKKNYFIATQTPLKETLEDFFQMVFDYDIHLIIMLSDTKTEENNFIKYWKEKNINNFYIENFKESKIQKNLIVRNILYKNGNTNKKKCVAKILNFDVWNSIYPPNMNEYYSTFIEIIEVIDQYKGNSPILVHSLNGCGRTGTFIAIYNIYQEIRNQVMDINKDSIKFSIFNLVRKMKEMRHLMVENERQYKLIYEFADIVLQTTN